MLLVVWRKNVLPFYAYCDAHRSIPWHENLEPPKSKRRKRSMHNRSVVSEAEAITPPAKRVHLSSTPTSSPLHVPMTVQHTRIAPRPVSDRSPTVIAPDFLAMMTANRRRRRHRSKVSLADDPKPIKFPIAPVPIAENTEETLLPQRLPSDGSSPDLADSASNSSQASDGPLISGAHVIMPQPNKYRWDFERDYAAEEASWSSSKE